MASALDYFKKGQLLYGKNLEREIKKHFGFFPFNVLTENGNYITRDIFFTADHPIKITLDKKRWSCGIINPKTECFNLKLEVTGDETTPNPFLESIWNVLTYKKSNKNFVTKNVYESIMLKLNTIFCMNQYVLIIKNKKYESCFNELKKLLSKLQ